MRGHMPQQRIGAMAGYRGTFAKDVPGLRFPIASGDVHHARNADRALQAAELKFSRHYGMDWRMCADVQEVEAV